MMQIWYTDQVYECLLKYAKLLFLMFVLHIPKLTETFTLINSNNIIKISYLACLII